jgi:hypothetical protein
MKKTNWRLHRAFATVTLLAVAAPAMAADQKARDASAQPVARTSEAKQQVAALPVVYQPPQRGVPGGRVGGGTRSDQGRQGFTLEVLAPDHTGWTASGQPELFWFISSPASLPVELTITSLSDADATAPLLEQQIEAAAAAGVHRARLVDLGVRLEAGVTYQWSVAVVPDRERRARDILASGTIQRVEPSGELAGKRAAGPDLELVRLYARSGYWYDAFEAVSALIERDPADAAAQRYRAALLEQVDLAELARQ